MTSSIKDTAVTDAPLLPCPFCETEMRREPSCWRHPRGKCILSGKAFAHEEAALWNTRSMEAKPDPEGLREALRKLSFAAQTSGGTAGRDEALVAAIAEAEAALTAKPSLEPTRTELVERLQVWVSPAMLKAGDKTWIEASRANSSRLEILSQIYLAMTEASALLSRKQSGGGNG